MSGIEMCIRDRNQAVSFGDQILSPRICQSCMNPEKITIYPLEIEYFGEKVMKYNGFDHDLRYLKNCSYKKEASAVGAAKHFLQDFIGKI